MGATFFTGTVQDPVASAKEGRPIFKEVPWVAITTPGDSTCIINQPAWVDDIDPGAHNLRYPAEWAKYQAGAKAEEQRAGTPLEALPGISRSQVQELKHFHVHTIEDLASMPDGNKSRFAGIAKLSNEAQDYIARAKGAAPEKQLRAELEKRDAELEALKKQMAELASQVRQGQQGNQQRR